MLENRLVLEVVAGRQFSRDSEPGRHECDMEPIRFDARESIDRRNEVPCGGGRVLERPALILAFGEILAMVSGRGRGATCFAVASPGYKSAVPGWGGTEPGRWVELEGQVMMALTAARGLIAL